MNIFLRYDKKRFFHNILKLFSISISLLFSIYILLSLTQVITKKVSATTETRYMQNAVVTVNTLTTLKLATTQTASSRNASITKTGSGTGTSYWGIRVWKINSTGTQTEITSGTPVAQVSRSSAGSGLQSETWTPTETSLATTDAIVVKVYIQIDSNGWNEASSFITEQLGNTLLEAQQWTIYYYTQYARKSSGPPSGRYLTATYHWGHSSYDSRIEGFTHSSGSTVITVGSYGTQRATVEPSTSDIHMGGAFTFVRSASSTNVTSITISNTGTVADSDLTGLILYYKQESTCSATIPSGVTTFNSTPGTFSSGSSTVTGTMSVSTSQVCVYAELDIGSGAENNETIEIEITNPSTQVSVSSGTVTPSSAVAISGTTTVDSNQEPSFTVFSDNGPKQPGTDITFTATSTDPNGDTVSLAVCKTTGYTTDTEGNVNHAQYIQNTYAYNPYSIYFKSDGTKFFTVTGYGRTVHQYSMSSSWDISTASEDTYYDVPQSQDNSPEGVFFSSDGTKMYILGQQNNGVFQFTLSTAWNVSTASYASKSASVGTQEDVPRGLFFNPDGTKMYIVGKASQTVYQYTLSTAWDVSTASYASKSVSVNSQDSAPVGLTFNSGGTKMYITGSTNNSIYQYTLSTAWDVSTASYASKSMSVTSQTSYPGGIFFNGDGTKLYLTGIYNDSVYQYHLPTISCDGGSSDTWCFSYLQASNPYCSYSIPIPTVDTSYNVYPYVFDIFEEPSTSSLQGALDTYTVANSTPIVSSVTINSGSAITLTEGTTKAITLTGTVTDYNSCYNSEISSVYGYVYRSGIGTSYGGGLALSEDTLPSALAFNSDGTKMYMAGDANNTVYQYSLSTGWDLSTAVYDGKSFSIAGQAPSPRGIAFSSDGTKMYVTQDSTLDYVYQYTLNTAWDVSTAQYLGSNYATGSVSPAGIFFKSDGYTMYILTSSDDPKQYTLSTAWDISSAGTPTTINLTEFSNGKDFWISSDGTKAYFVDDGTDTVYQYTFGTAWDITTLSYSSKSFYIGSQESSPTSMYLSSDGSKLYVLGTATDTVYQYTLSTAYDVSTATIFGDSYTSCDSSGEANNNNCYPEITCSYVTDSCTGATDSSSDYTCSVNLYSYADPTDTGTQYPLDYWLTTLKATDNNSASGSGETTTGVKLNSLIAFSITSSINYGSLSLGGSNDPLDITTTTTPTGNVGLDHEVYGPANMCSDYPTCSGYTIPVGNQKYALSASTAYSSGVALSTSPTEAEISIPKPTSGTPTTGTMWWGIYIPPATEATTFYGSITVNGLKSEASEW